MRVLIAPDRFAGTLTAAQAAEAVAEGWARTDPGAHLVRTPLSDGGAGFLDAVQAAVGGDLLAATVTGLDGAPVPGTVLLADGTAYVEAAQAVGLHLVPPDRRDVLTATSYGVGELVRAAVDAGARQVVVALGGGGANDGGAGLLAALGAGDRAVLGSGPSGLGALVPGAVDVAAARAGLRGAEVLVATDVRALLHGLRGATVGSAQQRGARREQLPELEEAMVGWAAAVEPDLAHVPGAGADGGLGYGLLVLGARRVPARELVMDVTGFRAAVAETDLVVTGEGTLDWASLSDRVTASVAAAALPHAVPVIVLAGQVLVGRRELAAMGVESAYPAAESPAEVAASLAHPAERLADLAQRVARTWSRR